MNPLDLIPFIGGGGSSLATALLLVIVLSIAFSAGYYFRSEDQFKTLQSILDRLKDIDSKALTESEHNQLEKIFTKIFKEGCNLSDNSIQTITSFIQEDKTKDFMEIKIILDRFLTVQNYHSENLSQILARFSKLDEISYKLDNLNSSFSTNSNQIFEVLAKITVFAFSGIAFGALGYVAYQYFKSEQSFITLHDQGRKVYEY